MRKHAALGLAHAALVATGASSAAEKLSPVLERWLEYVSPILTKTEKEVFRELQTNAERETLPPLLPGFTAPESLSLPGTEPPGPYAILRSIAALRALLELV